MTTVVFDIDGTLIDKYDKPRKKVIDLLRAMVKSGFFTVYCWSGSGIWYTEQRMRELKLSEKVTCFGIKQKHPDVDIAIDDQVVTLGKINIQV